MPLFADEPEPIQIKVPDPFSSKSRRDLPVDEQILLPWNPQPTRLFKLAFGRFASESCQGYTNDGWQVRHSVPQVVFMWNNQPISDEFGPFSGICGYEPPTMCFAYGPEEEWELKPTVIPQVETLDDELKKVKFDDNQSDKSFKTVATEDLFAEGIDDILYEGDLMKFKPGISANFVNRYVQISTRAFRYFRNRIDAIKCKPIVSIRKRIIVSAKPYKMNKASYLKRGSKIAQSGKEDHLFDNAFEMELNEHYEDNYQFKDVERAIRDAKERREFHKTLNLNLKVRSEKRKRKGTSIGSRNDSSFQNDSFMKNTLITGNFSGAGYLSKLSIDSPKMSKGVKNKDINMGMTLDATSSVQQLLNKSGTFTKVQKANKSSLDLSADFHTSSGANSSIGLRDEDPNSNRNIKQWQSEIQPIKSKRQRKDSARANSQNSSSRKIVIEQEHLDTSPPKTTTHFNQ